MERSSLWLLITSARPTKADLVKEIQKVIPEVDVKSLMRTNIQNLYLILDMVIDKEKGYQIGGN